MFIYDYLLIMDELRVVSLMGEVLVILATALEYGMKAFELSLLN